jgi:DNA modification methylase
MDYIEIKAIRITEYQREPMPWTVENIETSMKDHGYNNAYPVVLDDENNLIDGGHRIAAAIRLGLTEVPFIRKPDNGLSNIRYALICNADRAKGREDDVFDLAELCWRMGKIQGLSGDAIAKSLGWATKQQVNLYGSIKIKLHPIAWRLARYLSTRKNSFVDNREKKLLTTESTIVDWKEAHFRPITKHLPLTSPLDHATYRAQISVVNQCLYRWQKNPIDRKTKKTLKVTAVWIEEIAQKEAWCVKLKRYAADNLKPWVGVRFRIELFQNITIGIFGDEETQEGFTQLKNAIEALNGKSPSLYVGSAENMHQIEDGTVDIIITSPPYNLGKSNWPMGGDGRKPRDDGIGYDKANDARPETEYQDEQVRCLAEMYRVSKPGASLFYNHKVRNRNNEAIFPHQWLLRNDNPWTLRQEIIWDRTSTHNHNSDYFYPEDERIFWMVKGRTPNLYNPTIGASIVWRFFGPVPNTHHPAPFPDELPRRCLQAIGGQNLIVLDPFAGSCTTLRVALSEFGHNAIGYDISQDYIEIAKLDNGWLTKDT